MAIQNLPAWIGSQAVAETGQRWMSQARPVVRLPPTGWMSEMAGRSKFNGILTIGRRNSSICGFSRGDYGALNHSTGQNISVLASTNRDWDQGINQGVYISNFNAGYNRCELILEGFNNNEVLVLPNHGTNGVDGSRLYFQNWRIDVYNWMTARLNQSVNVLIEFK